MTTLNETVKNIIRIEKETYDFYRLVDKNKLDRKSKNMLKKCAVEASRNLQTLEEKIWKKEPSLMTFLHHFIPQIEFELYRRDECRLMDICMENRKELYSLYSDLSIMNDDPELSELFKEIAERFESPVMA